MNSLVDCGCRFLCCSVAIIRNVVVIVSLVTLVVAKSSSTEHLAQYAAWTMGCEPTVTSLPWQMPLGGQCPYESLSSVGWQSAAQIQSKRD